MARRDRSGQDVIADINITPFTDVVLVLLIIFMIATPLIMAEWIKVTLPVSKKEADQTKVEDVFAKVSIDAKGTISLNDRPCAMEQLTPMLRNALHNNPGAIVSIDAAGDALYEKVVQVIDSARSAGIERYVLVR